MSEYSHLFGPVPSRRLGRSLGIDLVPLKTCSFDCIFCQAGETTSKTSERLEYVSTQSVIDEFDRWISSGGTADYITFSGSGEPTLHSGIGDIINAVRARCSFKIALLTNSTLLYLPEVRAAVSGVDLVKVSLSAPDQGVLAKVNRPGDVSSFDHIIAGLRAFRGDFSGEIWHEVFVLNGINDSNDVMRRISELSASFSPDRVHLNTVTRTPATDSAHAVDYDRLIELADFFNPKAEVIAGRTGKGVCDGSVGTRPVSD